MGFWIYTQLLSGERVAVVNRFCAEEGFAVHSSWQARDLFGQRVLRLTGDGKQLLREDDGQVAEFLPGAVVSVTSVTGDKQADYVSYLCEIATAANPVVTLIMGARGSRPVVPEVPQSTTLREALPDSPPQTPPDDDTFTVSPLVAIGGGVWRAQRPAQPADTGL